MRIIVSFMLCLFVMQACSTNAYIPLNDRYPMPWRKAEPAEASAIDNAFLKNNMIGCSEYYLRQSSIEKDDYLVACTGDNGKTWEYHVVVTSTENIFQPDGDINEKPVVF